MPSPETSHGSEPPETTSPVQFDESGDWVYPESLESGHKAIVQEVDSDGARTYITTHRHPDGTYYTIRNSSLAEASNRLHDERHKKDALEHGLYRLNKSGQPIRPAPSSEEFVQSTGLEDHYRGSNKYKNGSSLGSYAYLSSGRGPDTHDEDGNSTPPSNEEADIQSRSQAIIASQEARDRALAEGKSLQEAQAIGEKVWRVHYGMGSPVVRNPESNTENDDPIALPPYQAPNYTHGQFYQHPHSTPTPEGHYDDDMKTLKKHVKHLRRELSRRGINDKVRQDSLIWRSYRLALESPDATESDKNSYHLLWEAMGRRLKGVIPF